jgi:putative ABC transport system permease protein
MNDLRIAFRQLRRAPGFTAVAVATLGLGLGACVAIFSVVDGVLLRPLTYPESQRLVTLQETNLPRWPAGSIAVAPAKYFDWQKAATSVESLAAYRGASYNLTGAGPAVQVEAIRMTANTLATLRVRPLLGRDFTADEDVPGHDTVVLLSHGFWQRQLGGRPDAVGQTLQLGGRSLTVIGVLPPSFQLHRAVDVYAPAAFTAADRDNRTSHTITVIGRLAPGVTPEQANAEMAVVAEELARRYPAREGRWGVRVTPLLEARVGEVRVLLLSLLGAVSLLLSIACANVAHLLLARASARAGELKVRAALGASRGRLVRQLLVESLLLALAAGLLGLGIARAGTSALLALAPDNLPRVQEIGLDGRAVVVAALLVLTTGVAFGLVPAFQSTRLGRGLRQGGSTGRQGLRGVLVAAEVAIALVLLAGAGLLMRSFVRLQAVHPGFTARGALAVGVALPPGKYPRGPRQVAFVAQALERLVVIPGVTAVGAVAPLLPFASPRAPAVLLSVEGRPGLEPDTAYYAVSAGYFQAMGIPVLRGRAFEAGDRAGAKRVTIINQALARRYFSGQDPVGKRIKVTMDEDVWREIVGVVGDIKHGGLDREVQPQTYEPITQVPFSGVTFVVRAQAPAALAPEIAAAVAAVDRDQPIASLRPLSDWVAVSTARQRFAMLLFAVFSAVAMVLAAVGIYGVMGYAVARRTREIGIRMALGSTAGAVVRLFLRQGGTLVVIGIAAGVVGALLVTRFLGGMLYATSPHDPGTFAAVALLLALAAGVASVVPARRATRVDPMVALRQE